MSRSPCGGCPPHCQACTFSTRGETPLLQKISIIVPAAQYGCVKGFGDVVRSDGRLGQMRGGAFHPVTEVGAVFLRESGNTLAAHL